MRAANPIDHAIRTIPSAWFTLDRRIDRAEMVLSAALGWSTFVAALTLTGWTGAALLILAAFSLNRAVLFTREITLAPDSSSVAHSKPDIAATVAGLNRRASQSHG